MNIKKRCLSLSLACVVALNTFTPTISQASSLDDMTMSNVTSAGTWKSSLTGATYFSGPNVEFRFKGGQNYTPLISYSMPKVKAGCNGLSLKGGFMSLLGLDDIKDQLQNAGTSLAWGVVVGLVMSLPAIAQTFEFVQKWVRTIQNLLQNSCSIGKNIGSGMAKNIANNFKTDVVDDIANSEDFKGVKDFLDGAEKKREAIDKFVNCATATNALNCKASVKKTVSKFAKKTLSGTKDRSIAKMFSYYDTNGISLDGQTAEDNLNTLLSSTGSFGGSSITKSLTVAEKEAFLQDAMMFKLRAALKGMTAVNFNSDAKRLFELVNNGLANNTDKDKMSQFLSTLADNPQNTDEVKTFTTKPVIKKGFAVQFLMNGFNGVSSFDGVCTDASLCNSDGFTLQNHKIKYINAPLTAKRDNANASSNTDTRFEAVFLVGEKDTGSTSSLEIEWDGFLNGSKKGIDYMMKKKKGVTVNDSMIPDTPLVLPNINRYLDIIHKIETKQGGETVFTQNLKQNLADANAIFATQALIKEIDNGVENLFKGSTKISTDDKKDEVEMKRFNDTMAELRVMVQSKQEDGAYLNEIENLYDKIERSIRKNAWNNLQD
jgi:hypothetical protein